MEKSYVGATGEDWVLSPLERILVAGRAFWFYVAKLLWPAPLIFFYPRWTIDTHVWWQYVFPIAVVGLVVALWLARRRIGRGPLAAVLIFGVVLVPALGFFDVFPFRYSFVADHFQYHASIALFALAAAGWSQASDKLPEDGAWFGPVAAGSMLLALGFVAFQQTQVYRNLQTLYEHVVERNPESWVAQHNLGNVYRDLGRPEEAAACYRRALALRPNDSKALYNYATVLAQLGDLDKASAMIQSVLEIEPDSNLARHELGLIYYNQGKVDLAIEQLSEAVRSLPSHAAWRVHLAVVLIRKGDLSAAASGAEGGHRSGASKRRRTQLSGDRLGAARAVRRRHRRVSQGRRDRSETFKRLESHKTCANREIEICESRIGGADGAFLADKLARHVSVLRIVSRDQPVKRSIGFPVATPRPTLGTARARSSDRS